MPQSSGRWYPTQDQLNSPSSLERSFRQLLDQHYSLMDRHEALLKQVNKPQEQPKSPPPGCGPTDTQILGLRVASVDTQTLADGTKLTYVKASGNFQFK